ncbi:cache domain-containing protein [bacterium]|nr:cache domain-containing protein [bacterium]
MVLVTFIPIVILGYFWISQEYKVFKKESDKLRQNYIETQKSLIKNEVDKVSDYIDYMRSQTEIRLKETIRERVLEAHSIANHIYEENAGKKTNAEIVKMIKDTLRVIRFNDGRGYYFATSMNGTEVLFADRPEMEGRNLLDMQDTQGKYIIRDMIEIVETRGEGFYQYTWTKPNIKGNDYPKITYIKHFEPLNLFIGTGEYPDDVEKDIQKEVLQRIAKIRFGDNGYIFVVSFDGITLMNDTQRELIGVNIWEMEDPNGVKVIQEERKAAMNPSGDYIHYVWNKPATGTLSPKISFVKGIKDWEWMFGAGVYVDDIEGVIANQRSKLLVRIKNDVNKILFIMVALIGVIFVISKISSNTVRKHFDVFFTFFATATTKSIEIDENKLNFQEFKQLAHSANHMIGQRIKAENDLRESEKKFRTLISNISDVIVIMDINGIIQYKSPNIYIHFGWDPEELIGTDGFSVIHPNDTEYVKQQFLELLREPGLTRTLQCRYLCKDGSYKFIELTGVNLMDNPHVKGIMGNYRDITDRRKAETDLRESEERLKKTQIAAKLGNWEYDIATNKIWGSEEAFRIFGIPRTTEYLSLEETESCILNAVKVHNALENLIKENRVYDLEYEIRRKDDGRTVIVHSLAELVRDENGAPIKVTGFIQDITERKLLEEQLQRRQRIDSLGTLAGGIAHDFNNLLAGIMGYIDLLKLDTASLTESQKNYIDESLKSCSRAASLIREIQTLSKSPVSQKTSVDICEVAQEVFNILSRTTDRLIEKKNEISQGQYYIHGNADALHQVLLNLGTNAVQAIEERGVRQGDYIKISADRYRSKKRDKTGLPEGEYIHIMFEDNGAGMTDDVKRRAFDPLFTTKNKSSQRGQGLGLAMVYNIVTSNHNGCVEIESSRGKGTIVHLYLPKAHHEETSKTETTARIMGGNETILVVEDEQSVRELAQKALKLYGYTVISACDGIEGLEMFKKYLDSIDLIILDLTMPRMSGKELLEEMVSINGNKKIIISSGQSDETIHTYTQAMGFVSKPYTIKELVSTVRTVLDT